MSVAQSSLATHNCSTAQSDIVTQQDSCANPDSLVRQVSPIKCDSETRLGDVTAKMADSASQPGSAAQLPPALAQSNSTTSFDVTESPPDFLASDQTKSNSNHLNIEVGLPPKSPRLSLPGDYNTILHAPQNIIRASSSEDSTFSSSDNRRHEGTPVSTVSISANSTPFNRASVSDDSPRAPPVSRTSR
jgi:hypothetical protein